MKHPPLSDTLVVSTQRSGLNWIRYCVETLSGRRTPGLPLRVQAPLAAPSVFDRTHDAAGVTGRVDSSVAWVRPDPQRHARALLLLRDWRETFVRHADGSPDAMANFVGNLRWFDAFGGERLVAYYEDFTQDREALARVLRFLRVDADLTDFDLAAHERASRGLYDHNQAAGGGSMTRDDPRNMRFHQQRVDPARIAGWEAWMRAQLGPLFEPYLGRYA